MKHLSAFLCACALAFSFGVGRTFAAMHVGQETSEKATIWVGQETGQPAGQETGLTARTLAAHQLQQRLETLFSSWAQLNHERWVDFAEHCRGEDIQVDIRNPTDGSSLDHRTLSFYCLQNGYRHSTPGYDNTTLLGFFELSDWPQSPVGVVLVDQSVPRKLGQDQPAVKWDFVKAVLKNWLPSLTYTRGA